MTHSHPIFSPEEYAEVSVLARLAGESMISRLDLVTLKPKVIVDLGCGTGLGMDLLKSRYPDAQIYAVDNAETMLRYIQKSQPIQSNLICADTATLPFRDHSVDFIFANLLLPWCDNWEIIFREWRRILRPEGLLMFTCFGPDTLRELQGDNLPLPRLIDMHEIGDLLTRAKFSDPVMDVEYINFTYREQKKLFHELRVSGMWMSSQEMELIPVENVFSLSYEIVYGHAFGPEITAEYVADEEGVVKIPLSHLRRRF